MLYKRILIALILACPSNMYLSEVDNKPNKSIPRHDTAQKIGIGIVCAGSIIGLLIVGYKWMNGDDKRLSRRTLFISGPTLTPCPENLKLYEYTQAAQVKRTVENDSPVRRQIDSVQLNNFEKMHTSFESGGSHSSKIEE